jgi:hypothetical protein
MAITPFLALNLGGNKDAILARQRARRVASLLSFDIHEQACIAAATFVIACQALKLFGKARLCFQIENRQLQIYAQERKAASNAPQLPISNRLAGMIVQDVDPKALFRMIKPLPQQQNVGEEIELGWLVKKVEETAGSQLFDEIIKQNQEILSLLHELRIRQLSVPQEDKSSKPHAA